MWLDGGWWYALACTCEDLTCLINPSWLKTTIVSGTREIRILTYYNLLIKKLELKHKYLNFIKCHSSQLTSSCTFLHYTRICMCQLNFNQRIYRLNAAFCMDSQIQVHHGVFVTTLEWMTLEIWGTGRRSPVTCWTRNHWYHAKIQAEELRYINNPIHPIGISLKKWKPCAKV